MNPHVCVVGHMPRTGRALLYEKREVVMNHSLYCSDRKTHLKIVVVGVLCAFVFLAVSLSARIEQIDLGAPPVKAGAPHIVGRELPVIR